MKSPFVHVRLETDGTIAHATVKREALSQRMIVLNVAADNAHRRPGQKVIYYPTGDLARVSYDKYAVVAALDTASTISVIKTPQASLADWSRSLFPTKKDKKLMKP